MDASQGQATDISFFKNCECWFYATVSEDFLAIDDYDDEFFEILHDGGIEYTYYATWHRKCERYREAYRLE